ncbi:MAG TPA: hypothetical protein VM183_16260 [Burkholderiales bacterium]|nr:hypothetical protein [Burkholderiales bacterium]
MPHRFNPQFVQLVPEETGIFRLFHDADLVYVGRTPPRATLRAELDHALTMAMAGDMSATHFSFEVTATPKTRAAEELRDYCERCGCPPRYNASAPPRQDEGEVQRPHRAA